MWSRARVLFSDARPLVAGVGAVGVGLPVYCHGASHGPWKDETYCKSPSEPHCPRYFKSYNDFGPALKKFPNELMLKDFLTEEMYNRYEDKNTNIYVYVYI